jgi:hypothetical protein
MSKISAESISHFYDASTDALVIDGIQYSMALFLSFSLAPQGALFEIIRRENGVVSLKRRYDLEREVWDGTHRTISERGVEPLPGEWWQCHNRTQGCMYMAQVTSKSRVWSFILRKPCWWIKFESGWERHLVHGEDFVKRVHPAT